MYLLADLTAKVECLRGGAVLCRKRADKLATETEVGGVYLSMNAMAKAVASLRRDR